MTRRAICGAILCIFAASALFGWANRPGAAQDGVKPMAADAKPQFDVATIRPSSPDRQGKIIAGIEGRHVLMINTSLTDLVAFAYGLDSSQIVAAPRWSDDTLYDIDGTADAAGRPDTKQMREMFQQLLADRFKLTFHGEQRTLPVYAITVAKGGPRLAKTQASGDDPAPFYSSYGALKVTNNTMADIADVMKFFVQKPVIDRTGLTGRYDFQLKWTPEESQQSAPDAPPGLFTAIQEQLGLKLEPVKAPVDVIVIDHVEKPSAN